MLDLVVGVGDWLGLGSGAGAGYVGGVVYCCV